MSVAFEISFARAARDWYLGAFWASTHYDPFIDSMDAALIPDDVDGPQRDVELILPAMESIK